MEKQQIADSVGISRATLWNWEKTDKMKAEVDRVKREFQNFGGMGLGITVEPELFSRLPESIQILTENGIVAGSLMAVLLNLLFNTKSKKVIVSHVKQSQKQAV
ncbi:hypothetical protein ACFS5O_14085 [Fictibacillus nanhaiensis]|uniref:hypothetical protein n=1 Tax=Fictibacillus nanhaiensis TaxID=742169 RepID=UPI00362F0912